MNRNIVRYQRQLKKHMPCGFRTRNDLLTQFRSSLSVFLDEQPEPTYGQLIDAFGPPDEMAAVMMAAVAEKEQLRYHKCRKVRTVLAGFAAIMFIAFSLYVFYIKEVTIISFEGELIPDNPTFSQESE